jgi:hypothetical protein
MSFLASCLPKVHSKLPSLPFTASNACETKQDISKVTQKINDILAIHGGDPLQDPGSKFRLSGRIIFFSGKTGKVLRWVGVPDDKESYYSPQVYQLLDGLEIVLFGTGGETHGGSLWYISLDDLYKGEKKIILPDNLNLLPGSCKGSPP